jgi:hypothetical protein
MSTDVVLPVTECGPEAGTAVLAVNGQAHALRIEPRVSLLDALREHLGLTGSKKGCDQGTRSLGPAPRREPRPSRSWSTTPTTYGFTHHVLYNIPATAAELTTQTSATAGSNTAGRRHLPRSGSPTGTRAPLLLLRALPPRRRPRAARRAGSCSAATPSAGSARNWTPCGPNMRPAGNSHSAPARAATVTPSAITEELITDAGYDPVPLGGLDKARAVEDLAWVLVAAMKDGARIFYRFAVPGER